jgi:UDP-N-acetyl-D-mannosaminuronate dehydrogenase
MAIIPKSSLPALRERWHGAVRRWRGGQADDFKQEIPVKGANVLILDITFKENCPDVRNTKIVDIIQELRDYDTVHDPWANPAEVKH